MTATHTPNRTPLSCKGSWYCKGRQIAAWSYQSRYELAQLKQRLNNLSQTKILSSCRHVKSHGGVKGAVATVQRLLPHGTHVARFDIYHYYQSMQHAIILSQLQKLGISAADLAMVEDYLSIPDRANSGVGMLAGGSIATLLAALYLDPLDQLMRRLRRNKQIISYTRYMDDYIIICKSSWQLHKAIAKMHKILNDLQLSIHPAKKFIGRVESGFDFLGYPFQLGRKLRPSKVSYDRLRTNARRLYERAADINQLLRYLERWQLWIFGGLRGLVSRQGGVRRTKKNILNYLHINMVRQNL